MQKSGEQLAEYVETVGYLRMMADKAYPKWSTDQRLELVRDQFIQGVQSSSTQLRLMKEMPKTVCKGAGTRRTRKGVVTTGGTRERSYPMKTLGLWTNGMRRIAIYNAHVVCERDAKCDQDSLPVFVVKTPTAAYCARARSFTFGGSGGICVRQLLDDPHSSA